MDRRGHARSRRAFGEGRPEPAKSAENSDHGWPGRSRAPLRDSQPTTNVASAEGRITSFLVHVNVSLTVVSTMRALGPGSLGRGVRVLVADQPAVFPVADPHVSAIIGR